MRSDIERNVGPGPRQPRALCLGAATVLGAVALGAAADPAPVVRSAPTSVVVAFTNEVRLEFAVTNGLLLGLRRASVRGVQLKSPDTCQRPVLAQEWPTNRMIWPFLRLEDVRVAGNSVELHCQVLGTTNASAFRDFFVFTAERERALAAATTPEWIEMKKKRDAAEAEFRREIESDPLVRRLDQELAAERKRFTAGTEAEKKEAETRIAETQEQIDRVCLQLIPAIAAGSPAMAQALRDMDAFEHALLERSLALGDIHRDAYRFAHTRQPEDGCAVTSLHEQIGRNAASCAPSGRLVWVLAPDSRNVAGWPWIGWKQSYRFSLESGRRVNVLRQVGTWEIDGNAVGLTVVNLRYRGLGRIEQQFTPHTLRGVAEAFSTMDFLPGAASRPAGARIRDRARALRHRFGAGIGRMARGAGHGFVDFQYRTNACFCAFFTEQGNLRALTEAFPEDLCVSQTDEEWFPLATQHVTQAQVYLALVPAGAPFGPHEARTRWQELDQYVRDLVSMELGFVQREALPGVGILSDAGWADTYRWLAGAGAMAWSNAGVRLIACHNPGWINGRYQGPGGPPKTGGGVCNVYDWVPTKDVEQPWTDFQKACAALGIAFYPWIGQTCWRDAPFVKRVGSDPRNWSLNAPGDACGAGYGPDNMKGNILGLPFRQEYTRCLGEVRARFGFQGFWCDSFHNLFMSQLDWAGGTGGPQQRAWWEWIAEWTRNGAGWMAEGHAFPGLSCGIEVPGWEEDVWFFPHVWKWHRGDAQSAYTPDELDRLLFRVMSNKGWTAPDHSCRKNADFAIPSFRRMAAEYLAALPHMRRSYILPGEAGLLWLGFQEERTGIWFAFSPQDPPPGVAAAYILDAAPAPTVRPLHTYRVESADLLVSFGVRRGPLPDPRLGRAYAPTEYAWPVR